MPYGAMRLRWCGLALRAFLARWGVLLLVTAFLAGAGSNGPVAAVAGLAGWLVLPLAVAATRGPWLLPAWLAQAVLGAALVAGARAMLWPTAWREAERALPLPRAQTLRSDALVVALTLLPLWALQAAGAAALLAARTPWLQGHRALAISALASAALGSLGLGVALLQRLRRGPLLAWPARAALRVAGQPGNRLAGRAPAAPAQAPALGSGRGAALQQPAAGPLRALVWLPLWRGPAQRTGQTLVLATAALCLPAAGLVWRPGAAGWWLAAWALAALLATTRLATLARLELAALHAACVALPIAPQRLLNARLALPLLALLPGLLLAVAALLPASGLRPAVLAAWVLACMAGCAVEAWSAPAEPAAKASRWLFTLALCVALGSEVLR
jgi:hypothetical protein